MVQGPLGRNRGITQQGIIGGGLTASEQLLAQQQDLIDLDLPGAGRMGRNRPGAILPPLTSETLQAALEDRKRPRPGRKGSRNPNPQLVNPTAADIRARAQSDPSRLLLSDIDKDPLTKQQARDALLSKSPESRGRTQIGDVNEPIGPEGVARAMQLNKANEAATTAASVNEKIKDASGPSPDGESPPPKLDKENAKNLAEQYASEISSLFPEFEGKTRQEKGMDLARLGMAIAAGDSPNAIQNISKGFLAMGDTFSEDAKEKRQYERQVKFATAQAVLDRLNTDRKNQFELNKLGLEADQAAKIAANDRLKDVITQFNEFGMLKMDKIQPELDKYVKSLEGVADAENAKLGLQYAARNIFVERNVQGVNNFLKDKFNKALNAIGITDDKVMEAYRTGDKELTKTQLERLEAQLAPILLGESGKTISDRDRDLVRRLMGNFTDIEAIYKDPESIKRAFEDIERMLNETIISGNNAADAFEANYGNYFIQGPDTKIDVDTGLITGGKRVSQLKQVQQRKQDQKKQDKVLSIDDIGSFEGTGEDMQFVLK
tara:strand:- start:263 stop:1906 length:1644 start_codon:yes stop_codon:yes gene_type:complete